jgi:hypothetical protein
MKKLFSVLSLLLVLLSCTSKDDTSDMLKAESGIVIYPQEVKSSILDLNQRNLKEIILLLHNKVETEEIIDHFKMNNDDYGLIINTLYGEGLVKKSNDGKFIPACMVVNSENEKEIRSFTGEFGSKVAEIIIDRYKIIRDSHKLMPGFAKESFEDAAMFILYNALLDKWQIKNIEEKFLRAKPPQRSGERYYLLINQRSNEEPSKQFSLLGNWCIEYEDYYLCTFGDVWTEDNFADISRDKLISDFGMSENEDSTTFKKHLIDNLVKSIKGLIHSAPPDYADAFTKYGIVKSNRLSLARITKDENKTLFEIAEIITNDLIRYLDNQRPQLVKHYLQSVYKEETSFREWSFWIYKYIIAEAANRLIEKEYIKTDNSKLFNYIIAKE